MWVLGIKPGPLEEQLMLLTMSHLYSPEVIFLGAGNLNNLGHIVKLRSRIVNKE